MQKISRNPKISLTFEIFYSFWGRGSKSLPLFAPETGGGSRVKNRSFKQCGDIYRRTYWNIHGRKEFVWRCVTRIEQGPEVCKNRTVKEDELYDTVMTAINKLLAGGNNMIKTLEENIHAVIGETTEYQISEINNLLEEKQKELIKLANKGQDYEHLADEIDELRDKRQTLLVEDASLSGENERIDELIEFIRKNKFRTLEYDDKLVREIIQSVTVYEDHFVI